MRPTTSVNLDKPAKGFSSLLLLPSDTVPLVTPLDINLLLTLLSGRHHHHHTNLPWIQSLTCTTLLCWPHRPLSTATLGLRQANSLNSFHILVTYLLPLRRRRTPAPLPSPTHTYTEILKAWDILSLSTLRIPNPELNNRIRILNISNHAAPWGHRYQDPLLRPGCLLARTSLASTG